MKKFLFTMLILLGISLAQSVVSSSTIDSVGSVHTLVNVNLGGYEGKEVTLFLMNKVDEVVVRDKSGLILSSTFLEMENYTAVSVTVPYDYLSFEILSDHLTTKSGPLWVYGLSFAFSENLTSIHSHLELPPSAIVKSTNGAVSGNDGTLSINWQADKLNTGHKVSLRAGYELEAQESGDYGIYLIVGFSVTILILLYFAIKTGKKPVQNMSDKIESQAKSETKYSIESSSVFLTLDDTDKKIVREIFSNGGKTTQAQIYLNIHIPKVTLSRRLDSLENRGIIEKSTMRYIP